MSSSEPEMEDVGGGYYLPVQKKTWWSVYGGRTILLSVLVLIYASFLIVPYTLPPGTVTDLDGFANRIDYNKVDSEHNLEREEQGLEPVVWKDLHWFAAAVYFFGDLNCHQIDHRSEELNGNQLPVCMRDMGIFAGMLLAAVLAFKAQSQSHVTHTIATMPLFPKRWVARWFEKGILPWMVLGFIALLTVPIAVDGITQLITGYESTNPRRLWTGLLFGFGLGILFGGWITTRPELVYYVRTPSDEEPVSTEEDGEE